MAIAADFNARAILSPSAHRLCRKGGSIDGMDTRWFSHTVATILRNEAHMGTMVAQRRTTVSYKNHKIVIRPEEEWVVIENHHPAIVDKETFEICRQLRVKNKKKPRKNGEASVLSGLLYCSDCNSRLRFACVKKNYEYYNCMRYQNAFKRFDRVCSHHSIRRDVIEKIVLAKIQETVTEACRDREAFARRIYEFSNKENDRLLKSKTAEIAKAERRVSELDKIIKRIYEDSINGRISDDIFEKFLHDYSEEQSALKSALNALREDAEDLKAKAANIESFFKLIDRHAQVTELSAEVVRLFIEKVVVYEPVKKPGTRFTASQQVDIYFNYIGMC
jgi:hypothetical protein